MTAENCKASIERITANFPEVLRKLNQWVVWRMEQGNKKPTKVPYSPQTGLKAKSTDPTTWSSFEQACQAYLANTYTGVGFVFTEHDPYVGIDFDQCVEAGAIKADARKLLQLLNSYTEYSQSNTGVHVFVEGTLPPGGRKSQQHQIEMYECGRFFVVTGNHLPETTHIIAHAQSALEQVHSMVFSNASPTLTSRRLVSTQPDRPNDEELLQRMFASANGAKLEALWHGDISAHHHDHSAADLALCNHLAFWTRGDPEQMDRLFRQSSLMRDKWDQKARQGETYGQGTIARALAGINHVCTTPGLRLAADTKARHEDVLETGQSAKTQPAPLSLSLPVIIVNNRQLPEITNDALAELNSDNQRSPREPKIYVRGGQLTRIIQDESGEHWAQPLTESAARGLLARSAQWVKVREDKTGLPMMQPIFPPTAVVRDLLALAKWPGLTPLTGIVHCPTFTPAGQLHGEYGYNVNTQLFNACPLPLPNTQPTAANIVAMKRFLLDDLLADFPFDSQASLAHAVALFLLPFVRPMIDGPTPIHAIDSPTPGTGKGLLANVCSYAARGRDLAATPAAQDDSEWRKRLTAVLLRADTHILIDNINQPLASAALAAALTQPVWSDRLLGQTCSINLPINQIWIATGNNLVTSDEIARRCIRIRLDANLERPDQRQDFKHTSLMSWVRQQRAPLMAAAITLINAWIQAGMPRFTAQRKGSYEAWGEIIGGILQTVGIEGFLKNEHELYTAATTETARLVEFVETWYHLYGEQEVQVKELFKLASQPDIPVPSIECGQWLGLLEDALGSGNELSRRTKLGRLLDANQDKVIAGYKLLKNIRDKKRPRFCLHRLSEQMPAVIPSPTRNGSALPL